MPELKKRALIVDHDPRTVKKLRESGFLAICGDMSDDTVYEAGNLYAANIIISTIPSAEENRKLLSRLSHAERRPVVLMMTGEDESVASLYDAGADFVIYPHLLGGDVLTKLVSEGSLTKSMLRMRERHMKASAAL